MAGGSPVRACSAQVTLARDCSERGRRGGGGGSAWLTWVSHRRRAGAGSHRAIQRCICCSQVRWRLRGTGCSLQRPIRNGDGCGRARYGGYVTLHRGMVQSCTHSAERSVPGALALPREGGGCRSGMTGSTTEIAPCPNISLGWPCPWALWWAAVGGARDSARRKRRGGGPFRGGHPGFGCGLSPTMAVTRLALALVPDLGCSLVPLP